MLSWRKGLKSRSLSSELVSLSLCGAGECLEDVDSGSDCENVRSRLFLSERFEDRDFFDLSCAAVSSRSEIRVAIKLRCDSSSASSDERL